MGTNFYCAGPGDEHLHIGKSSIGWKFGFHAVPEFDLISWKAWRAFLKRNVIFDEYGTRIPMDEFERRVEERGDDPICRVAPTPHQIEIGWGGEDRFRYGQRWWPATHDEDGYDFNEGAFS